MTASASDLTPPANLPGEGPPATPCARRAGPFVAILLLLNLQLDGFTLSHHALSNQLLLLPITLIACALLLALLLPQSRGLRWLNRATQSLATPRATYTLSLLFLVAAAALFVKSAFYYAHFGYRLHPVATTLVFAAAFTALAVIGHHRRTRSARALLAALLLSFAAISALSIWSFPLNSQRSDMLPLLQAANQSFLGGVDPYHLYTFPAETVYLTYLPGTLLAYLPATLAHVDLRLVNLACVASLVLLVYRALIPRLRLAGTALLGLWLLSPYLLYRHELYTEPHWLALVASLLLLNRHRVAPAAVLFGVSIAMSQFSWVLFPFFLLYLWQSHSPRSALAACALSLGVAAILTLPFFVWSPHAFVFGVLTHWHNTEVSTRPINLAFVSAHLIGTAHLQLLQAVCLAALFLTYALSRGCRTFSGCLQAMSLALTVFTLLNVLVWGYFFLLLELLLLLYVASTEGWLQPPAPSRSTLPTTIAVV